MFERPPRTTPFKQSVQSWGYYGHFILSVALHGSYLVVTRVPSGQAFTRCAVPSFDLSGPLPPSMRRLLRDGLCLHELQGPPLGSNPRHPARNCEMRMFICELMYAEVCWRP
jgi:hypothetical protein